MSFVSKAWNWVKEKWHRFKKWIVALIAIPVVLAAPIVPVEGVPIVGTEKPLFNTSSGWIEEGQWALVDSALYICEAGDVCQHDKRAHEELVGYDVSDLREVKVVGTQFFTTYDTGTELKTESMSEQEYKSVKWESRTFFNSVVEITVETVEAAITTDNSTNSGEQTNSSSVTLSSFVVGGTEIAMVAGCSMDDINAADMDITDLTWNGSSITDPTLREVDTFAAMAVEAWYQTDATAATANVVYTFNGTVSESVCGVSTWNGTDTVDANDAQNGEVETQSDPNPPDLTIDTNTANTIIIDFLAHSESTGSQISPNQIELFDVDVGAETLGSQYQVAGAAGTYTSDWTHTNGLETYCQIAIAIKESVSAEEIIIINSP